VIQRGIRFRVELLDKEARGYICENYGALLRLPIWGRLARTDWRIRATFWRQWRALKTAKATFILLPVSGKAMGGGHRSLASERSGMARELRALQYDLANFNCINTVSFDHPDPSIIRC